MKLKVVTKVDGSSYGVSFMCPGCGDYHVIVTAEGERCRWNFNGDMEAPVFSPSLLVRSGHYAYDRETPDPNKTCYCTAEGDWNDHYCYRCHSFIGCNGAKPGQIIFLGDCTHPNAGRIMDLPDIPD